MRSAGSLALALLLGACGSDSDGPGPVDAATEDATVGADASTDAAPTSDGPEDAGLLGPPYPIVLAHGFFGFDDFAGAGFLTYFYGVRDRLAAEGETLVYTPEVDPFNSSDVRGAQLVAHVETILAETGHAKVNLIGHSQGGLDARVVAFERPDLVASVTTVATPHRGSRIADIILGLVEDDRARDLVDRLVQIIGAAIYDAAGMETSVVAALEQFSSAGVAEFNATYRDRLTIDYYSLTGRTDLSLGGDACRVDDAPPFIARYDGTRDPVDPLLALPEEILDGSLIGTPFPNDGLVRVTDARWGRFLGCVPADHLDEVGQLLGDGPGLGNDFDHEQLYVDLVAFVRAEGH